MRPLLPVLMMIAAPAPAAAEQPVLSVAHTPAPPAIDGLIGDDEWAASPLLDGMASRRQARAAALFGSAP